MPQSCTIVSLGRPVYNIDFNNSVYTHYVVQNDQHVFIVEQGARFVLKLTLSANPMPTSSNLYKNGQLLHRSPLGTIYLSLDTVSIQTVQNSHDGNYMITCSNIMGEGRLSFQIRVVGKPLLLH